MEIPGFFLPRHGQAIPRCVFQQLPRSRRTPSRASLRRLLLELPIPRCVFHRIPRSRWAPSRESLQRPLLETARGIPGSFSQFHGQPIPRCVFQELPCSRRAPSRGSLQQLLLGAQHERSSHSACKIGNPRRDTPRPPAHLRATELSGLPSRCHGRPTPQRLPPHPPRSRRTSCNWPAVLSHHLPLPALRAEPPNPSAALHKRGG
mmetsp:Transcript_35876/g.98849  ORF Transcript_35876/g.98849 Transcript_35876/m.98849 type:complete len:205 (-) Transcript_35876:45-659(-)